MAKNKAAAVVAAVMTVVVTVVPVYYTHLDVYKRQILYFVYDRLAGMLTFGGNMVQLLPFSSVWWIMLIGFLVAGVLTGMCGSAISMGKYLKEEGG